jgi:hypothetical protein
LRSVRQVAVDHQVPDVLEAAGPREVDSRVLAIVIKAFQPPDVTEFGVGDDDTREASRHVDGGGRGLVDRHVPSLNLIRLSMLD